MKTLRKSLIWAAAATVSWLVLCAAIGVIAVENALHLPRREVTIADQARADRIADRNFADLNAVSILAGDGVTLRGWSIRPHNGNGDAVILLHGQSDNRVGMLGNATMLLRHGYAVLLPDSREHGTSGGDLATYGFKEADDVRQWFLWLRKSESPHCIYGLGASMGAAQLLQSLPIVPDFCAVSAESSFSTFREVAYDRIGQGFNSGQLLGRTLLRPAVETGFLYAHWKYGIELTRISPQAAVANTRVPVLLIHGLADTNIPPRHSRAIRKNDPAAELWEPELAWHCAAATVEPMEYERRVVGWFQSHSPR